MGREREGGVCEVTASGDAKIRVSTISSIDK
jgi:hypothetical protein